MKRRELDPLKPFEVAEDVFWVGCYDSESGLNSNAYLIADAGEAVVINSGSRSDFPRVMMKILQTGIIPSSISALIYQSYDPRVCGSIPHMEDIIARDDLKIISDHANHMFIRHYCERAALVGLGEINLEFGFRSGRKLQFITTPYAHSAGSFVTFDSRTGILFTGDLFSGCSQRFNLFLELQPDCYQCDAHGIDACSSNNTRCALQDILEFHQYIMPSERALRFALEQISTVPFTTIAPQHGWIIDTAEDIVLLCDRLASLQAVGIDKAVGNRAFSELGNTSALRNRLKK